MVAGAGPHWCVSMLIILDGCAGADIYSDTLDIIVVLSIECNNLNRLSCDTRLRRGIIADTILL